ncbi:MAG: EAL domain-containing protein, partial [Pseudomonadota bacterium]
DFADIASDWFWETDREHRFSYFSARLTDVTGVPREKFIGKRRDQLANVVAGEEAIERHRRDLESRRPFRDFIYWTPKPTDGSTLWVKISGQPVFDADGDFVGYRGVGTDITAEMLAKEEAERARLALEKTNADLRRTTERLSLDLEIRARQEAELRVTEAMFDQVEQMAAIGVWSMSLESDEVHWSPQIFRIYGLDPSETPTNEIGLSGYGGAARRAILNAQRQMLKTREQSDLTLPFVSMRGRKRWVRTIMRAEFVGDRARRIFGTFQDVTEERERTELIERLARRDSLTGLANRARFKEHLSEVVDTVGAEGGKAALVIVDLDRFKEINDTLGHGAGDVVLQAVAARLERIDEGRHFAARLGGDELAYVVGGGASEEDFKRVFEQLHRLFDEPVHYEGQTIRIRGCLGAALFPDDAGSVEDLLKHADLALYDAKNAGRARFTRYRRALSAAVEKRAELLREIDRALRVGELEPFYQPIICLSTGEQRAFEALVRWRHPKKGLLTAGAFHAVFEDRDLGPRITECVLSAVLRDMRDWLDAGQDFGRVNVNLTGADLKSGRIIPLLLEGLEAHGIEPRRLGLELTETMVISEDSDHALAELDRLSELGAHIALDDFGTGYASLSHLKRLPVNALKIDRSFVRDLTEDPRDHAIVRSLTELGRRFGFVTVAEGVETREHAIALRQAGCQMAQGFLISPPRPKDLAAAFIGARCALDEADEPSARRVG